MWKLCRCLQLDAQLDVGVALGGVEWVDSTVAVVVRADPQLLRQLQRHAPPLGANVPSVPQVHLAAEIEHQRLEAQTR